MNLTRTPLLIEMDERTRQLERAYRAQPSKETKGAWIRSLHKGGQFHKGLLALQDEFREKLKSRDALRKGSKRSKSLSDRAHIARFGHELSQKNARDASFRADKMKAHPKWVEYKSLVDTARKRGRLHRDMEKKLDRTSAAVDNARHAANLHAREIGISSSGKHLSPKEGESMKDHLYVLGQYHNSREHSHQHVKGGRRGQITFNSRKDANRFAKNARRHYPDVTFTPRSEGRRWYEPSHPGQDHVTHSVHYRPSDREPIEVRID